MGLLYKKNHHIFGLLLNVVCGSSCAQQNESPCAQVGVIVYVLLCEYKFSDSQRLFFTVSKLYCKNNVAIIKFYSQGANTLKETHIYGHYHATPLSISYYPAKVNGHRSLSTKPAIIYFHGGGLIFGDRDDLPSPYIERLTSSGYPLVTVDYPLAPEAKLADIFQALANFFAWFQENHTKTLHLHNHRRILFGRSAGAYLALQWANKIKVEAIISFYGYYTFFHNQFSEPSPYFTKYPEIPDSISLELVRDEVLTSASVNERYPLYLSYRQKGTWTQSLLSVDETLDAYSLKVPELKQLPPTFLAASRADEDVPFFLSNLMSKIIPHNQFIQLDQLPHDFDRDPNLVTSIETYNKLINWLEEQDF